jgi:hypothetical protein
LQPGLEFWRHNERITCQLLTPSPKSIEADSVGMTESCQNLVPLGARMFLELAANQVSHRLDPICRIAREHPIQSQPELHAEGQEENQRDQPKVEEEPEQDFEVKREPGADAIHCLD